MKKIILSIFGLALLAGLSGCVGPAYHSGIYGGAYSPHYRHDSVYLYDYPYYPGYYGSYYRSHSHFHHSTFIHKRASDKFDRHRHLGKHFSDRSPRHKHFGGSHDQRSYRNLHRGPEKTMVKGDRPSFRRGFAPDDNRRASSIDRQRGDRRVNGEFRERPGKKYERSDRQNSQWGHSGRGKVKCIGQRC